jgi:ankyrin repeat protein
MPSDVLQLMYTGDRIAAERVARTIALDIFEAAALGALEALIERSEEDASRVNAYTDDGWTPLHLAAYFGNETCVKELVRRGAAVGARSHNGMAVTARESALSAGYAAIAAIL